MFNFKLWRKRFIYSLLFIGNKFKEKDVTDIKDLNKLFDVFVAAGPIQIIIQDWNNKYTAYSTDYLDTTILYYSSAKIEPDGYSVNLVFTLDGVATEAKLTMTKGTSIKANYELEWVTNKRICLLRGRW